MPAPTAPEPLDPSARDQDAPAPSTSRGDIPAAPRSLGDVPAFLRARASKAGPATARAVVQPPAPSVVDVAALPMLGIAPRRLVVIGLTVVLAWMLVSFGRQVAEASAASSRAEDLRSANAALVEEVDALERELKTIQDARYIAQAARGYRLGTAQEIPFALAANAPPLEADAPGSAAVRVGAETDDRSPFDAWMDVLFGPGG